ncbi:lipocalin-like domain-containing protein [Niveispirillum sp.]|uniref:lipocalin-like domain-containing protein n=1 Tax=Niveispirillum sp. TaxID=1917217 RepID=UPI001B6AB5A9|nr:lipocalin-like domain-containing protein [Niveispirillum sp.]MBP7336559.1 lipocalin-like domain-containing protein [Niveispirillum sp.]
MVTQHDILGCWQLHAAMEQRGGCTGPNPNYGSRPNGFLYYLPDGRVAVTIANDGRKPLSGTNRRMAPAEELAEAARTFDAYAGRFTLLAPDRIVHHVEVSSCQNEVGTDLVRQLSLNGDLLRLEPPPFHENDQTIIRWLVWRRLSSY